MTDKTAYDPKHHCWFTAGTLMFGRIDSRSLTGHPLVRTWLSCSNPAFVEASLGLAKADCHLNQFSVKQVIFRYSLQMPYISGVRVTKLQVLTRLPLVYGEKVSTVGNHVFASSYNVLSSPTTWTRWFTESEFVITITLFS